MNDQIDNLGFLLRNMMNKVVAREKKPHVFKNGEILYRFEMHILSLIGKNPDINVSKLAETMNVTKGAISQVINKLIRKNYVIKLRDNSNRRMVKLNLTKKGKVIFEEHEKFHERFNSVIMERFLDRKPEDRKLILEILINMNDSLDDL
jgi:DNA-binding MarR family transcriptional regulator